MSKVKINQLPNCDELRGLLDYDPLSGSLIWRIRSDAKFDGRWAGKQAGTVTSTGHFSVGIKVDEKTIYYKAHRLVWKMMTGDDPAEFVDHKNGNGLDNRWDNLRVATNGENMQNAKLFKNNKARVKGVFWHERDKKWVAQIRVGKERRLFARFKSRSEAVSAINAARLKLHGEFARMR